MNRREKYSDELKNRFEIPQDKIDANKAQINRYFNHHYTFSLLQKVLKPINDIWFRPVYVGFEQFPERNNPEIPLIFATNHSGMAFPWDAAIFIYNMLMRYQTGKNSFRVLVSPKLTDSLIMNPFLVPYTWEKVGTIDATMLNFETIIQDNRHNLLIYPEGVAGIGKGFNRRYQLQELKTSFIRMSIKYKTDIIPFATVNGEFINPFAYISKKINKLAIQLGLPFLPLGFSTFLAVFQPWIFYIAFPAKLTFVMGKRIKPYEWIDKPYNKISHKEFKEISRKVHFQMQAELNEAVKQYGKKPYNLKDLLTTILKNISRFHRVFVANWALLFVEHDRKYYKSKNPNKDFRLSFFKSILVLFRKPITICLYIPIVGWIPIAIYCIVDGKKKKHLTESKFLVKSQSELLHSNL